MKKSELRALYKQKRYGLSKEAHASLSETIADIFVSEFYSASIRVIHSYLPVLPQKEVDTLCILRRLLQYPGVKVQVPVVQGQRMVSVPYASDTALQANTYGLLEPIDVVPAAEVPDLVITPLLAFDTRGYRVGYGGGYYDRYFTELPSNVLKVGLSFFPSVGFIEDIDEFDVPLDYCISPDKVYSFQLDY